MLFQFSCFSLFPILLFYFFCGYLLLFQNGRKKCVWCPPFHLPPQPQTCEGDGNQRLCSGSSRISAEPQHSLPAVKSGRGALGSAPLLASQRETPAARPSGVAPGGAHIPITPLAGPPCTFLKLFHFGRLPVLFVITSLCYGLFAWPWPRACTSPLRCSMSVLTCDLSRSSLLLGVFLCSYCP